MSGAQLNAYHEARLMGTHLPMGANWAGLAGASLDKVLHRHPERKFRHFLWVQLAARHVRDAQAVRRRIVALALIDAQAGPDSLLQLRHRR